MDTTKLRIGDVFRAKEKVSNRDDGKEPKNRYFIYLGRSGIFDVPVYVYPESPTTKDHDEDALKKLKCEHPRTCIDFTPENSGFPEHCVLCLDFVEPQFENYFDLYKLEYEFHITSQDKLHEILEKLDFADIAPVHKRNIKESFSRENIN